MMTDEFSLTKSTKIILDMVIRERVMLYLSEHVPHKSNAFLDMYLKHLVPCKHTRI